MDNFRLRYTPQLIAQIIKASKLKNPNGRPLNIHQIAIMFRTRPDQVSSILRTGKPIDKSYRRKAVPSKPKFGDNIRNSAVEDYYAGLTSREVAAKYNVSQATVSVWARKIPYKG